MGKKKSSRAAAIEGVRWYFSEERPPAPRPKPFILTYMGEGVVEVPEVGLFQNGTTAEIGPELAREYEGKDGWLVGRRRVPPVDESRA
jgi:hypothetical protein